METPQQTSISTLLQSRRFLLIAGVVILLLLVIFSVVIFSVNSKPEKQKIEIAPDAEIIPDEIMVKFREGVSPEDPELKQRLADIGVISSEQVDDSGTGQLQYYYKLILKPGTDVRKVHDLLYEDFDQVELSQPNYPMELFATVDDPMYSQMWSLQKIDIESAWDISKGSSQIKVAIIDSGIDVNHSDLPTNIAGGNFTGGSDNGIQDENGHGTHVAGTIGALTNNGDGIAGINWNVQLLAYKVFGASGKGNPDMAGAIKKAARDGAKIINMSLGNNYKVTGPLPCSNMPMYQDAINDVTSQGVIVIVAAGNDNVDVNHISPASCDNVITVGATGPNDERAGYSNFGSKVDLAAPGGNELRGTDFCTESVCTVSTWLGGYSAKQGTSMATPHVAGVAALLLAHNSALTPDEIKRCLVESGDSISTDKPIGGKRLNAYNALNGCGTGSNTDTNPPVVADPTTPPADDPTQPPDGVPRDYFIRGVVYEDKNKNLSREADEGPVRGVTLTLSGAGVGETVTGDDGAFSFMSLQNGTYLLTASVNGVSFMEYIFTLDNSMASYQIPIPMPPQSPDDPPAPVQRENRSLITGTVTPTPTPRPLYTCRERTTSRQVNNKTVQMKYLDCSPK